MSPASSTIDLQLGRAGSIVKDRLQTRLTAGKEFDFLLSWWIRITGKCRSFWFDLDEIGQWAVAQVPKYFLCWPKPLACCSAQSKHAAKRVDNMVRHSPLFYGQAWKTVRIKDTTRDPCVWQIKAGQVRPVRSRSS